MFQSWTSYLLGAVSSNQEEDNNGATAVGVSAATGNNVTDVNSRLTTDDVVNDDREEVIDYEQDWVLVDVRDSEGNSEEEDDASSLGSFDVCPSKEEDGMRLRVPGHRRRMAGRGGSPSSLPCTSAMEESWFLTPPPCFISTAPANMETSPLENLLIEHPSMSVYQHQSPSDQYNLHIRHVSSSVRSSSSVRREEDDDVEELLVEDVEDEGGEQVAIVRRVVQRRLGPQQLLQELQEKQFSKSKQAQKVQIQKASQPLKKAYLERNNKAREVNCRNRRQRRGERSQGANRSRANNNRKC